MQLSSHQQQYRFGYQALHEAIQFVEKSDLVNATYVLEHSKQADLVLEMLGDGLYQKLSL